FPSSKKGFGVYESGSTPKRYPTPRSTRFLRARSVGAERVPRRRETGMLTRLLEILTDLAVRPKIRCMGLRDFPMESTLCGRKQRTGMNIASTRGFGRRSAMHKLLMAALGSLALSVSAPASAAAYHFDIGYSGGGSAFLETGPTTQSGRISRLATP